MFQGVSSPEVLAKRLGVDPSHVTFGVPVPQLAGNHTVTLTVTSKADQSVKDLRYTRRSITSLLPAEGLEITRGNYRSTQDILHALRTQYAIVLSDREVLVEVYPESQETFTIHLHPNHLLYVGSFVVRQVAPTLTIANLIPNDCITGCILALENYPDPHAYYHFTKDYSAIASTLLQLVPGDRVTPALLPYLNACTDSEWEYKILSSPLNLYWARIVYNDSTTQYTGANTNYQRVVAIELNPQYCTQIKGVVCFHYNL